MADTTPAFQQTVWAYYRTHGRHDLPWRRLEAEGTMSAYKVLVSELMLQQTQVPRVIPKFQQFIAEFPSFEALAAAPLAAVLKAWSGLGYNRRAKFLWQAAGEIITAYGGQLPRTSAELIRLPGIGSNTAGALLVYVYNQPVVFVETNIRTVFIHHFFADQQDISDCDILEMVASTFPNHGPGRTASGSPQAHPALTEASDEKPALQVSHAREWYWALMDYGTYLKQAVGNLNTLSKHYTKQSAFHGSRRQLRGQVLRLLGQKKRRRKAELTAAIADERLVGVLDDLVREGLVQRAGQYYKLPE